MSGAFYSIDYFWSGKKSDVVNGRLSEAGIVLSFLIPSEIASDCFTIYDKVISSLDKLSFWKSYKDSIDYILSVYVII